MGHAAAVIAGDIYVIGGDSSTSYGPLKSAERFNPVACRWEVLPPMLRVRRWPVAVVISRQLYIIGGADDLSAAERFDPVTARWEVLSPMPAMRYGYTATVISGLLYVLGG